MPPVHDIDAVILLATALAAKRRPAALTDIVAGASLLQGFVIYPDKLGDALARLSQQELISADAEGFSLTSAARQIIAGLPGKGDKDEHLAIIHRELANHPPRRGSPLINLPMDQLAAAVLAYKVSAKVPGRNLLMPKPKADRFFKKEGRWHCVPGNSPSKKKPNKPRP